jgi:uncharacterized YigZ family protein
VEDIYFTIAAASEGLYKEKGSKFIAFAYPVSTEDEIAEHLAVIRKKYYDARHHCYAWRLGHELTHFRSNDDGEPSGSAGLPILGQIRSKELTNVVVVVVRYFGGVKLGVGGLVQAYKTATADAFTNAEIVERTVDDVLTLDFDYLAMNDVMRIVKDHDLRMQAPVYELRCSMQLIVRRGMVGQISALLSKVENLTFEIN